MSPQSEVPQNPATSLPPAATASPTTASSSSSVPASSSAFPQSCPGPKPKRLRPSQMSNVDMYRDTIRNPPPGPSQASTQQRACPRSSSRSNSSNILRNSSLSARWSSTKNVRNITTGHLDLGMLPINVSPDVIERFLEISQHNSSNKLETGGLLGGVLEDSVRFKVTKLIIPKQNCRSDYWEALCETEIQEFFTRNDLLLLGCIHTHPPPWTSFLSSVDLHQLFDFQKDNPSAISIVVAPDHMPSHVPGYAYSLTDLGLTVLADCRRVGVHQHRYVVGLVCLFVCLLILFLRERNKPGHETYIEARHLTWDPDLPLVTADLRGVGLQDAIIE